MRIAGEAILEPERIRGLKVGEPRPIEALRFLARVSKRSSDTLVDFWSGVLSERREESQRK
jgi:hypothetical protein